MFISKSPYNGTLYGSYAHLSYAALSAQVARLNPKAWQALSYAERGAKFLAIAERMEQNCEALATIIVEEVGKPIAQARGEVLKSAKVCRYYAEHAETILQPKSAQTIAKHSQVIAQALGGVLAIMPWNFPFWQVFRAAAPAMMAGNVFMLKHAPNVPRCAKAIEDLFSGCGCDDTVFQNLFISTDQTLQLIAEPSVNGVTFTGSEMAGRRIAATTGGALKKVVLELGGSDAFIVLNDADVEAAAKAAAASRLNNTGQTCNAAKRFIVQASVYEHFLRAVIAEFETYKPSDVMGEDCKLGVLARPDLAEHLDSQVQRCISAGAMMRLAGGRVGESGFTPVILEANSKHTLADEEEFFGPVAMVYRVETDEEALHLANATPYGLCGAVFTTNEERAALFVNHLEVGMVSVNQYIISDPAIPFGGIKHSGFGRELGEAGIWEFVNVKSVVYF